MKAAKAKEIPFEYQYLNVNGIAAMRGPSARHVRENAAGHPEFSVAYHPPGIRGRISNRIWKASEVIEWMERYREGG